MSKSETGPKIPVPSIPDRSSSAPVPDKSDYAGFGHEWTPPPTGIGNGGNSFPKDIHNPASPFVGGNSAGRK